MKKIFESEYNGWNESAEKIHVYELESDEELRDTLSRLMEDIEDFFDEP